MQYHGGDIYRNQIRLDFSVNTNPLGMPDSVREALHQAVEEAETPDSSQMQTVSKAATGQKTQAIPKAQATQNVQMTESNTQETIEGKRKTRADSEKNR